MSAFPRTMIEGLSVPRMIIGTNWFLGYSHTTKAKDRHIKATMTPQRVADVLEVYLAAGIDAVLGDQQNEVLAASIQEAQHRTGKNLIRISIPALNHGDRPEDFDDTARKLDKEQQLGVNVCMPHQLNTDALVDRRTRTIRNMDSYCRMIRQRGMIPGLSTHMPETPVYADESGLDVATYIQIYNAAGFLMQVEVDWVHRIINKARKPVITIKPFAAGRLHPFVGLAFNWSTIRDQDMVCVGTNTPDEAKEVIEMSLSLLQRRQSSVELQQTRSKTTLEQKAAGG